MLDNPIMRAYVELAHKRSLPPRHNIIHHGDDPHSIYLILEGSVSVLLEDEQGREVVLAYLNQGEFFGEMCLFPHLDRRSAIVRTRTPAMVAEVGYKAFRDFAREQPEIVFMLAGQLAERLRDTSQRVGDLAFLDVAGRIAHTLMSLAKKPDSTAHPRGTIIKLSRQELSRNVGCSREMAGRVLKKLEEDGMVQSQGRSILVIGVKKPA